MTKIRYQVVILVLAISILFGLFSNNSRSAAALTSSLPIHNINTGLDYATIQEAIDANETLDGHKILVDPGTYYQDNLMLVGKSLTIRGSGSQNTILNLTTMPPTGYGMLITTSNVLLEGFTITVQAANRILIYVYGLQCANLTIRNNIFIGTGSDILALRNTEQSRVTNNILFCTHTAFGAGSGISLLTSNYNTISNNSIYGGWAGIVCQWGASNNTIVYNTLTGETQRDGVGGAIVLAESPHGNLVIANNLTHNEVAIWYATLAADPSNNIFYHNNFIDNSMNIQLSDEAPINAYYAAYPIGGNFWSGYTGIDTLSGPNQNEPGSDGIGDTPYTILENSTDRYPLIRSYVSPCGDLNLDGEVDMMDAIRLASAFGSHLGFGNWNDLADLVADDSIDIFDAITLCHNLGQHGIN